MNGDARPRLGAFAGEPMPNEPERTPSLGGWRPPARMEDGEPDYGFDEPWFVAKTFGCALACAAVAAGLGAARIRGPIPRFVAACAWLSAGGAAALGASLVAYANAGKRNHRDRVLDLVPWTGAERVLDVGTGRGLLMIGAAKRLRAGKAVGIDTWRERDLSGNNRENTMRNAFLEGVVDRVEVRFTDARKLDFGRRTFDVVLSTNAIHNVPDREGRATACREIARVLKPGGIAIVSDLAYVDDYASVFRSEGLAVERMPLALDSFTYLRTLVIAKPPVIDLETIVPA